MVGQKTKLGPRGDPETDLGCFAVPWAALTMSCGILDCTACSFEMKPWERERGRERENERMREWRRRINNQFNLV